MWFTIICFVLLVCSSTSTKLHTKIHKKTKLRLNSVIIDPLLSNPLLTKDEIPDFTKINAKAVESAIPMLLEQDDKSFKEYEKHLKMLVSKNKVTWEAVETLDEKRVDPLGRAWGAASNMLSIKNSKEIRKAIEKYQGNVTEQGTKQGQSHVIYEAYKLLSKQKLNEGQRRIVDKAIRGLEHGGVNLPPNDKKKFIETIKSLSELTHKFKNNVLDYTSKFSMIVYNRTQLEGLPKDFLKKAAEKAAKKLKLKGKPNPDIGPWRLTLDHPSASMVIKKCVNREVRMNLTKAMRTRAATGPNSNTLIIEKIRQKRRDMAAILGYKTYADLSLETQMAKNVSNVWDLINKLKAKAKPEAVKHVLLLENYAREKGFIKKKERLENWDLPYVSAKYKEEFYALDEEKLKEYFPFESVREGLFKFTSDMFNIKIEKAETLKGKKVPVWDKKVEFFNLRNASGEHLASFFMDMYSRTEEKNDGAWMNPMESRGNVFNRTTLCTVVCNYMPPSKQKNGVKTSLLKLGEAETMFHEFGHALQHMLTTVGYGLSKVSGTSGIETDAVEIASMFLEKFVKEKSTLKLISSHIVTKEKIPDIMIEKIKKAQNFGQALWLLEQLRYASMDLKIHDSDTRHYSVIQKEVLDDFAVIDSSYYQDLTSFSHILGGGMYSAGYYSYIWSEVFATDLFGAIQEAKSKKEVEKRLTDTLYARGGERDPTLVYKDFRGRDRPDVEYLLKYYGLAGEKRATTESSEDDESGDDEEADP